MAQKFKINTLLFSLFFIFNAWSKVPVDDIYLNEIEPIFSAKCIHCHGCNASPCEMKLDSYDALARGANKIHQPYGKKPILEAMKPMRMKDYEKAYKDALYKAQSSGKEFNQNWSKDLGYYSVLNTDGKTPAESILYRMIQYGVSNNAGDRLNPSKLPEKEVKKFNALMKNAYTLGERTCADTSDALSKYIEDYPAGGMPLALPGLDAQEFATVSKWVALGAPGPTAAGKKARDTLSSSEAQILSDWEKFFNPTTPSATDTKDTVNLRNKTKLVSRYLYEHSIYAHIQIEGIPNRFFELVRARKAAPAPIDELVTETPMEDPWLHYQAELGEVSKGSPQRSAPFYYRLKLVKEVIVQKSHMIWNLSEKKKDRLNEIFYNVAGWPKEVKDVPYGSESPFINFAQIPALSRAKFLLDEAKLISNGMIRGPVCTGPSATYAIRDQFWIFFAQPETDITVVNPTLGADGSDPKNLEFMMSKNFADGGHSEYRQRFKEVLDARGGFKLSDVWNSADPNAQNKAGTVLTIFRHGTSSTVIEGAHGRIPPTIWFMTYAGIERLFYNLVTQYKFWGDADHRLKTWQTMRRHREEYEEGFISLLPEDAREVTRSSWTAGLFEKIKRRTWGKLALFKRDDKRDAKEVQSVKAVAQLVAQIKGRLAGNPAIQNWDNINVDTDPKTELPNTIKSVQEWDRALSILTAKENQSFSEFLPDALYLKLKTPQGDLVYSLLAYRGYDDHNFSIGQAFDRNKAEDHLAAFPGVIGDFPNLMAELDLNDPVKTAQFVKDVSNLNESNVAQFESKYAVMRNNPEFWTVLADIEKINAKNIGTEAGLLDLNYYEGFEKIKTK